MLLNFLPCLQLGIYAASQEHICISGVAALVLSQMQTNAVNVIPVYIMSACIYMMATCFVLPATRGLFFPMLW